MANVDAFPFTAAGGAKQIIDDLKSDSFVRATGPTSRITAMKITPLETNAGRAMYWGRGNVTTAYGARMLRGVAHEISLEKGTFGIETIWIAADVGGDRASIEVTLA